MCVYIYMYIYMKKYEWGDGFILEGRDYLAHMFIRIRTSFKKNGLGFRAIPCLPGYTALGILQDFWYRP